MINISQESPQDLESIYNLNLKAFESDAEAKLKLLNENLGALN